MTPVELALAVVWGVLFALFAYDRWKTPRSVLDRDLVRGVGTDLLHAVVNDTRDDRLRPDRVEQAVPLPRRLTPFVVCCQTPTAGDAEMRWQLSGDWPVGPAVIPAGTVLTGVVGPNGKVVVSPPLTAPLPLNAVALDEEAALQMCMWYEEAATIGGWHQLHFHHSVDREAILAQARRKKRWPNGEPSQPASQSISEASFPIAVKEEKPRSRKRR